MPFNATERLELYELISQQESASIELEEDEMEFFREMGNLRQLRTYQIINPPKEGRIVENSVLIFLLHPDFSLRRIFEEIFEFLQYPYRILVDFSFLLENPFQTEISLRYRYKWAQRSTALPLPINLIKDDESVENFLDNFPSETALPEMLVTSHQNQSNYESSGYQLKKLLTCNIFLTKLE